MADLAGGAGDETGSGSVADYQSLTVEALIDLVAAPAPAPAGGSVAAIAATLAAALASMTARLSVGHWDSAPAAAAQAEALRARLTPLAREDAVAYLNALERMRPPEDGASTDKPAIRDARIAAALTEAAAVPMRIAEAAADVAELAADIARFGNPAVSADATTAVSLACASTQAAAHIVAVNLRVTSDDELAHAARRAVDAAETAAHRALAAGR